MVVCQEQGVALGGGGFQGLRGDLAAVSGAAIYGASLIVMLACSAAYNMAWPGAWGWANCSVSRWLPPGKCSPSA